MGRTQTDFFGPGRAMGRFFWKKVYRTRQLSGPVPTMRENPRDEALHKTKPADAGGIEGANQVVITLDTSHPAPFSSPSKRKGTGSSCG